MPRNLVIVAFLLAANVVLRVTALAQQRDTVLSVAELHQGASRQYVSSISFVGYKLLPASWFVALERLTQWSGWSKEPDLNASLTRTAGKLNAERASEVITSSLERRAETNRERMRNRERRGKDPAGQSNKLLAADMVEANSAKLYKAMQRATRHAQNFPEPVADGSPGSRVVIYDVAQHAGLDDRTFVLHRLLNFARSVQAVLAFPDPRHSLGRSHGITMANSWTEYYTFGAPVKTPDEVQCSPDAKKVNMASPAGLEALPWKMSRDIFNFSLPLCLRIQVGYFHLFHNSSTFQMMEDAARLGPVSMTTSWTVANIMRMVVAAVPQLGGAFNAIHVRNKASSKVARPGLNDCNSPQHAVEKMTGAAQEYPTEAEQPWLLMSDGNETFFSETLALARRSNFTIVTEKDLTPLDDIQDSFLRYLVLECFFRLSMLSISTFKLQGLRCDPPKGWRPSTRFLCGVKRADHI